MEVAWRLEPKPGRWGTKSLPQSGTWKSLSKSVGLLPSHSWDGPT